MTRIPVTSRQALQVVEFADDGTWPMELDEQRFLAEVELLAQQRYRSPPIKPQRWYRLENQDAQHSVGVMCKSTSVIRFRIREDFVLRRIAVEVQWCRAIEKLCANLRAAFWSQNSV